MPLSQPVRGGLVELTPGLWRWSTPHPDWEPDPTPESAADWPREIGSVLYDATDATVLIDPYLADDDLLWSRLDDHVEDRGQRVAVLTTVKWHRRSRDALVSRYGASTSRARTSLPQGVEAFRVPGAGETIFWLPTRKALVPGDRLLGGGSGGLRLCPASWLRYLPSGMTREGLREELRPLLELPIELVLTSHGAPVLADGHAALSAALDE